MVGGRTHAITELSRRGKMGLHELPCRSESRHWITQPHIHLLAGHCRRRPTIRELLLLKRPRPWLWAFLELWRTVQTRASEENQLSPKTRQEALRKIGLGLKLYLGRAMRTSEKSKEMQLRVLSRGRRREMYLMIKGGQIVSFVTTEKVASLARWAAFSKGKCLQKVDDVDEN